VNLKIAQRVRGVRAGKATIPKRISLPSGLWIVGGRGDFLIRQIHDSQRHQRACTSADVFLRELA
jgi:hypothetical protein